jgi:hypothetical protein
VRAPTIRWDFIWGVVSQVMLPIWFVASAIVMVLSYRIDGYIGIDVAIYREAALAALNGENPWASPVNGYTFAGPPPTLLLFIPFAIVPLEVAYVAVGLLGTAAAVFAVRTLSLPLWWVLFPPVFESVIVGNPDVLVLALLLLPGRLAGLAIVAKVYAVVPLAYQRRWKAVAIGAIVAMATLPLWPLFIADLSNVTGSLDRQSQGLSAWGSILMVPTIAALWLLRRDGAEWLAVPALWPHTQLHYAAVSLPIVAKSPIAAAVMGLSVPLAPSVAVMIIAIQVVLAKRRRLATARHDD